MREIRVVRGNAFGKRRDFRYKHHKCSALTKLEKLTFMGFENYLYNPDFCFIGVEYEANGNSHNIGTFLKALCLRELVDPALKYDRREIRAKPGMPVWRLGDEGRLHALMSAAMRPYLIAIATTWSWKNETSRLLSSRANRALNSPSGDLPVDRDCTMTAPIGAGRRDSPPLTKRRRGRRLDRMVRRASGDPRPPARQAPTKPRARRGCARTRP
jgi:hypothetical protein